jgi:hypothetical protein
MPTNTINSFTSTMLHYFTGEDSGFREDLGGCI